MKVLMIPLLALLLAGCASINNAGHAAYSVKANAGGGYDFDAKSGQEMAGRRIEFTAKTGTLVVEEVDVKANVGIGLAVKAATILPVNDLPALLGVRPR